MFNPQDCELFEQPFFQFAQWKKYQPEKIPELKAQYKSAWEKWKSLHLAVSQRLGSPFAPPHIERWCNGWQMRAHFFAYYKYECWQNSAAILSVILNRRRLQISLDWHCYRAERSSFHVHHYNQWLEHLDFQQHADLDLWHGSTSEYADVHAVSQFSPSELIPTQDGDFWCIGRNVEKADLANTNSLDLIVNTIAELTPLYESCHQKAG